MSTKIPEKFSDSKSFFLFIFNGFLYILTLLRGVKFNYNMIVFYSSTAVFEIHKMKAVTKR